MVWAQKYTYSFVGPWNLSPPPTHKRSGSAWGHLASHDSSHIKNLISVIKAGEELQIQAL